MEQHSQLRVPRPQLVHSCWVRLELLVLEHRVLWVLVVLVLELEVLELEVLGRRVVVHCHL